MSVPLPIAQRGGPGIALATIVGTGTAVSVLVAVALPEAAWAVPGFLVILLAGALVLPSIPGITSPLLPLALVFVLAGLALQRSEGLQPTEILFAAFYLPYLAIWYALRLGVYPEPLARSSRDWAVLAFMLIVHASILLSAINHASPKLILNDWIAFSMFGFYFPVREVCVRYEHGVRLVFFGVLFLAFAALVRNMFATRSAIAVAAYAWEVARVRVTANEMTMTFGAILCASIVASSTRRWHILVASVGFALLAVGVILTQWRAFYVALALGVGMLGILSGSKGRRRLLTLVIAGVVLGSGMIYILFGNDIILASYGLLDRLLSIGTATSSDISLINRFRETQSVFRKIYKSPIIGYGIGSEFSFFDLTTMKTWTKPFAHNGYLTLWFKYGVIGLLSLLWLWIGSMLDAARVLISIETLRPTDRFVLSATLSMLAALILPFAVSNPLTTSDTALCFTLLMGLAAGIHDRTYLATQRYSGTGQA